MVGFSRFPRQLFPTEYVAESSPKVLPPSDVPPKVSVVVVVVSGLDGKRDGSDLSWCTVFRVQNATSGRRVHERNFLTPADYRDCIAVAQINPNRFSTRNTVKRRRTARKWWRTRKVCLIAEKLSNTIDFRAKSTAGSKPVQAFTRLVLGAPTLSGRTGFHPSSKILVVGNG